MKAVCGIVNDNTYRKLSILSSEGPSIKWSKERQLGVAATTNFKGSFTVTEGAEVFVQKASIEFKDLLHTILINIEENKTFPLCKIAVAIPDPAKYVISEFWVQGYFDFKSIVSSQVGKEISGTTINEAIASGKKIVLHEKLKIEILGPPLLQTRRIQTEFGEIIQLRNNVGIEI